MDYHIIKISRNKKQYLDLLLLGDEQETMIDRYLERGDLFVLEDNGIKAVGVVTKKRRENKTKTRTWMNRKQEQKKV